jgi:hypothetical protein
MTEIYARRATFIRQDECDPPEPVAILIDSADLEWLRGTARLGGATVSALVRVMIRDVRERLKPQSFRSTQHAVKPVAP